MFNAYVIEIGEETAGIVARDSGPAGLFCFYASSRDFFPLEGREFGSVQAAYRAAKRLFKSRPRSKSFS